MIRSVRNIVFAAIILLFFFSCKNQKHSDIVSGIIDIEHGLQNLTRLKVSDFGQTIRYIPLETPDNGLVGNNPVIKVLRNHIVIESQRSCLLFDKANGSFIAEIGHFGQGPEEFTDAFSWTDENGEFLYFRRAPNTLLKFDMKGNFCGRVGFSSPPGLASHYLFTDNDIIGYYNVLMQPNPIAIGIFDKDGLLKDSVPSLYQRIQTQTEGVDGVGRISIYKPDFIGKTNSGFITMDFKDGISQIYAVNSARIWKSNETIRFKENFVDTIYTFSAGKLFPTFVFNTGKYHWPIKEINSKQYSNERIFIEHIYENNNDIFFQCVRGFFSNEPLLYNGLYNKQTGETKLCKYNDAIEDDLTYFMPFNPLGISASGEFVSLVEAWRVMEWMEEHPEAMNNENLSFLKELDEEMNPIVILVE